MDGWIAGKLVLFMGLGVQELLIIFLAIIFLFGAKKIPEIARGLGKGMKEFKKGTQEADDEEDPDRSVKPKRKTDLPDSDVDMK
jgi:sec-independent protein translocase protein TatA